MIEEYDEPSSVESAATYDGVLSRQTYLLSFQSPFVNTISIVRCTKTLCTYISSRVAVANENWSLKSKSGASTWD